LISLIDSSVQSTLDFLFPRDEGRHAEAIHEWWYFNSHLETNTGRQYGLHVSFLPSRIYFILVDKSRKHLVKRVIRDTILKTSNAYLQLENATNSWRRASDRSFHYSMYLHQDEIKISLELISRKPPLFVNGSGLIKFGLLGFSRYYVLTNMKVSGTLQLNNALFEVNGIGWMDRQWGNWDYGGIGGWNWFSLQLSNNAEILVGQCFHPITGRPMITLFNMMDHKGRTKIYSKFRVECLSTWRSPRTNTVYGTGWKISLPQDTNLIISPVIEDQELFPRFWEGCCEVKGMLHGERVNGVGYNEQNYIYHGNQLFRMISLSTAPLHFIRQLLFGRRDFKIRKFKPLIFRKLRTRQVS